MSSEIISYIKLLHEKINSMPLRYVIIKIWLKIFNLFKIRIKSFFYSLIDYRGFKNNKSVVDFKKISFEDLKLDFYVKGDLKLLVGLWMEGCYDFLGSGPVDVCSKNNFDINILRVHKPYSLMVRKLISDNYRSKRWNEDFKSGYVWSNATPSFKCSYGDRYGVDIKLPWEFSRLQHLPQMAIWAIDDECNNSEDVAKEILDQILDFWSSNPLYMGPNWMCAMDVAIRAVNILMAINILIPRFQYLICDKKKAVLSDSIYHHGKFIIDNLEYSAELTSNHYSANIVGLLFISYFLTSTEETDCWLAFSIQEIFSEINKQYCGDGGNFERSSSYHRLTSEMFVWSLALIRGFCGGDISRIYNCKYLDFRSYPLLNKPYYIGDSEILIPELVIRKIRNSIDFTVDITKCTNEVFQFGDNDSGRFLKFTPTGCFIDAKVALNKYKNLKAYLFEGRDNYWDESVLDHSAFVHAGAALFNIKKYKNESSLEDKIVKILSKNRCMEVNNIIGSNDGRGVFVGRMFDSASFEYSKKIIIKSNSDVSLIDGLVRREYLETGVLIYKSKNLFLALSNMPNGAKGSGAHSHNDQMHIEIQINGQDISRDPGSYLYTSAPDYRNKFRGVLAHNVMRSVKGESNRFFGNANALFAKQNESKVSFLNVTDSGCVMQLLFYGVSQEREVIINDKEIVIIDKSNYGFDNTLNVFPYFSKAFGFLEDLGITKNKINIEYVNE